jgi:hypothetical protein
MSKEEKIVINLTWRGVIAILILGFIVVPAVLLLLSQATNNPALLFPAFFFVLFAFILAMVVAVYLIIYAVIWICRKLGLIGLYERS